MVEYSLTPVSISDAQEVCSWRYGPGYGMYDMSDDDLTMLLAPAFGYFAVRRDGALAGYACFGEDAQIYGGPYHISALDIGCGMKPALCGQGGGLAFFQAIVDFARQRFRPKLLRLTVAAANLRAMAVYERAGFVQKRRFAGMTRSGIHSFWVMTRQP